MSWVEDQFQAVLAQLRTDSVLADCTFDGVADVGTQRYVVVTSNDGDRSSVRLTGPQTAADTMFGVRCVGLTRKQVQALSGRVKDQLIGFKPVVTGRTFWKMRHLSGQAAAPDDTTPQQLFFTSDLFMLHNDPA